LIYTFPIDGFPSTLQNTPNILTTVPCGSTNTFM
jgi:hypothetical protein